MTGSNFFESTTSKQVGKGPSLSWLSSFQFLSLSPSFTFTFSLPLSFSFSLLLSPSFSFTLSLETHRYIEYTSCSLILLFVECSVCTVYVGSSSEQWRREWVEERMSWGNFRITKEQIKRTTSRRGFFLWKKPDGSNRITWKNNIVCVPPHFIVSQAEAWGVEQLFSQECGEISSLNSWDSSTRKASSRTVLVT